MEALRKVSKEARRILPSVFGVLSYFYNEIVEVHAGKLEIDAQQLRGNGLRSRRDGTSRCGRGWAHSGNSEL